MYLNVIAIILCPIGINSELLKMLSDEDISTTFELKNHVPQNVWYKSGILVDLTCERALSLLQKV